MRRCIGIFKGNEEVVSLRGMSHLFGVPVIGSILYIVAVTLSRQECFLWFQLLLQAIP